MVKVDVEGMELDVVRGAERTLQRELPLMCAEVHSTQRLAEREATLGGIGLQRTGRVFNASPTFEFAPSGDAPHA